MPVWFLNLNVMTGAIPLVTWILTAALAVVLLVRDEATGWTARALPAVGGGAAAGGLVAPVFDAMHVIDVPLPSATPWWTAVAGAGIGLAAVSLWRAHVWRRVLAIVLLVCAPLSAAMGVNAAFGLTPTIGAVFGIDTTPSIRSLPTDQGGSGQAGDGPLYLHWRPPADMPLVGRVGTLSGADQIPSTAGFHPRDATIYLPPAALVKDPPRLPLVVMMMGEPGSPTPTFVAAALNALAARDQGLAPIAIVVDQLGSEDQDPVCSDESIFGGVSTYVNTDVVAYARTHLKVIEDPRYWTIAGYSNGGACAIKWAAQFPGIWGNMISVSGDSFPGADDQAAAIAQGFRGSRAAYEAAMPAVYLRENAGRFAGHHAVFTAGALDPTFSAFARSNAQLMQQAGFTTQLHEIPGATHVATAVSGGLSYAFAALYPVLGLSAGTP